MAENKELEKRTTSQVQEGEERPERFIRPRTNIRELGDTVRITMDLPGVSKDNLEITFNRGELTIIGHRESWDRDNIKPCYCERFDGSYRRDFALDDTLDTSRIDAKLDKGILRLEIPKAEAVKPRQIQIKSG